MGYKVLVADDDRTSLTAVKANLESAGYSVETAANGQEALSKLNQEPPDLFITDVYMPDLDAVDLYIEIKKNSIFQDLKIIVLTAKKELAENFKKLGIHGFIHKPYSAHELLYLVKACIGIPPVAGAKDTVETSGTAAVQAAPAPAVVKTVQEKPASAPVTPKPEAPSPAPAASAPAAPSQNWVKGEGSKNILIIESEQDIIGKITDNVQKKASTIMMLAKEKEVISKSKDLQADLIVLNALVDGMPTNNIVRYLRKLPAFKSTPIVAYIYINQKKMANVSKMQLRHQTETAKISCMNAGVTKMTGEFDETNLFAALKEYLK